MICLKGSNLWVIIMIVDDLLSYFKLLIICLSLSWSIPDVASSSNSSFGCLIKARVSMIRCFSPPDKFPPFSSILPFNPPLFITKSYAFTFFRHFIMFSSDKSNPWFPYRKFYSKVPANKNTSWVTYDTIFCMSSNDKLFRGLLSMKISPFYGWTSFVIRLNSVDFPVPESPTKATVVPALIFRSKFLYKCALSLWWSSS